MTAPIQLGLFDAATAPPDCPPLFSGIKGNAKGRTSPAILDGITPARFPRFIDALAEYNRRCAERRATGRWTR